MFYPRGYGSCSTRKVPRAVLLRTRRLRRLRTPDIGKTFLHRKFPGNSRARTSGMSLATTGHAAEPED